MSLIEQITVLGIKCDRKGCERALYGPEMTYFVGHRYYERLAASEGWTFWVGRSRKVFCPDHGPSRGSKMWQSKPLDALEFGLRGEAPPADVPAAPDQLLCVCGHPKAVHTEIWGNRVRADGEKRCNLCFTCNIYMPAEAGRTDDSKASPGGANAQVSTRRTDHETDVPAVVPPVPIRERDLCWKPVTDDDGYAENCGLWENHAGPCLLVCGDCREGRCHIPIRPPVPGVGDPTCGCSRHESSIAAWRLGEDDGADVPAAATSRRLVARPCGCWTHEASHRNDCDEKPHGAHREDGKTWTPNHDDCADCAELTREAREAIHPDVLAAEDGGL